MAAQLRPLVVTFLRNAFRDFSDFLVFLQFNYKPNIAGTLHGRSNYEMFNAVVSTALFNTVASFLEMESKNVLQMVEKVLFLSLIWYVREYTNFKLQHTCSTIASVAKSFISSKPPSNAIFQFKYKFRKISYLSQHGNAAVKLFEFKLLAVAIKSLVTGRYPTHGGWKVKGVRLRCTFFQDEPRHVVRCKNSMAFLCAPCAAYIPTCECSIRLVNRS